jgi:hypothetical protein
MSDKDNFSLAAAAEGARSEAERSTSAWRILPIEGAYELFYCDEFGNTSRRRLFARELKVGPGKTLLGGIDQTTDAYRGFRADSRLPSRSDRVSGGPRNRRDNPTKRA